MLLLLVCKQTAAGVPFSSAFDTAVSQAWPLLKTNWVVWPLVHLVTFNAVPVDYRVPWLSVCGVFWAVIISIMS